MRPFALTLALSVAACGSASPRPERPGSSRRAEAASIRWRSWSEAVFEDAQAHDRMILLDVGIEGCTACRWMYEDTYRHPEVVRRVGEHFVAVAVDANARPDLGARYRRWGWPATIVLAPDGTQVLALRGNKRPRNFLPILDALIERHRSGQLVARRAEPVATTPLPDESWQRVGCAAVISALRVKRQPAAGWDRGMLQVRGAPIELEFLRAITRGDAQARRHALATAEAYASLLDPVWGGVFVARRSDGPIVEKRVEHNSAAIVAFAYAYRVTGEDAWVERARRAHAWHEDWMLSPEGLLYATQEDDAPRLPPAMNARDYYELDDAQRRAFGIPPIDHAVYTDLNGRAIAAYVTLYEATGDATWRTVAERAAGALLRERQRPEGWVLQGGPSTTLAQDARMRAAEQPPQIYLAAQARLGWALERLHGASGDGRWLEAARRIADATMALLAAPEGGFYAAIPGPTARWVPPTRPLDDNAAIARLLLWLGAATQEERYRSAAAATLRALTPPAAVLRRRGAEVVAELGLAYEALTQGAVEISIVAEPDDPRALPFREAAAALWEPRKVVHFEPAGRYPRADEPVVYVCTMAACSSPITDPTRIEAAVRDLGRQPDDRCR